MQQTHSFVFLVSCKLCHRYVDDTTIVDGKCSECQVVETKCCSKCNNVKPYYMFEKVGRRCKPCINAMELERDKIKRPDVKRRLKATLPGHKICTKCHVEKYKDFFREKRGECRDCERACGREYRSSEHGKQKSKEWIENNKDRFKELCANWFRANKESVNYKHVERYRTDPIYKLRRLCKDRLGVAIRKNQRSTPDFIGCPMEQLQDWLVYNYDENMNGDNHGSYWHIDHVIPVATFDLDDEVQRRICFSWYNLSPLEAKKNISKGAKIDRAQLLRHMYNLTQFTNDNVDEDYMSFCATHLDAGKP